LILDPAPQAGLGVWRAKDTRREWRYTILCHHSEAFLGGKREEQDMSKVNCLMDWLTFSRGKGDSTVEGSRRGQ